MKTSPRYVDRRTFPAIPTPPATDNVTYPYTFPDREPSASTGASTIK